MDTGSYGLLGRVAGRLIDIRSVPPRIIVLVALASYLGLILAALMGWPLWALVVASVLPWALLYTLELQWTYRHFSWLALFYLLVLTQGGHFLEHVAQMVQIHVLHVPVEHAHGIISQLDVELVHVGFNTWVLVAAAALATHYRGNTWLWVTLAVGFWHEIEHAYMSWYYLTTGIAGHPGFLAEGGLIAGGLAVTRPDLHMLYNVAVTLPLFLAFGRALSTTHNQWLARALPHLPREQLTAATARTEILRYADGETITAQGEPADAFYVIARGEVHIARRDATGDERHVATLGSGQFFGEAGLMTGSPRNATVRADGDVEVLRLDRAAFTDIIGQSEITERDLVRVVEERRPRSRA